MTNSPFHDPQSNPLPDANDIEQEATKGIELYSLRKETDARGPSSQIKQDIRRLRNAIIWLLVIGAVLGVVFGLGTVLILRRTGLLDTPKSRQESSLVCPEFASHHSLMT